MFLRINGVQVFVRDMTDTRNVTRAGRRERSFRGQQRDARRFTRRTWAMEAVIQEEEDATALKGLLWGLGHQVAFQTGFQASTGLNPVPGFGALSINAGAWGPNGQGVLVVQPTSGKIIQYDAQLRDDEWTVLWASHAGITGWFGNAKRNDGMGYRQGIRNDNVGEAAGLSPDGIECTVLNGVVELRNFTAARRNISDVVILPYKLTPAMMAAVSNPVANGKFGPCPALLVTGDIFSGATAVCVAEVTGVTFTGRPSVIPGLGWVSNAQVVSFTLHEVDPAFTAGVLNKTVTTPRPPGAPVWWFDGGDVDGTLNNTLAANAAVATWVDKGSRAQNATQAVGANQPFFRRMGEAGRIGSLPAVQFDGVNDTLSTTAGAGLTGPMTIACVHRINTTASAGNIYSGVGGAARISLSHTAIPDYRATRGVAVIHPTVVPLGGNWAASIMRYDGALSSWRINGIDGAPGNPGANSPVGMTLGSDNPAGNFFNGYVVEVLAWNAVISFDLIQAYLTARYGLLPQT